MSLNEVKFREDVEPAIRELVDQMIELRSELHARLNEEALGYTTGARYGMDWTSSIREVLEELQGLAVTLHNTIQENRDW